MSAGGARHVRPLGRRRDHARVGMSAHRNSTGTSSMQSARARPWLSSGNYADQLTRFGEPVQPAEPLHERAGQLMGGLGQA